MPKTVSRQELPAGPLASLVHAIHAAGVHDGAWHEVFERIRAHLDARVITLARHEFDSGTEATLYEAPADAQFGAELARYAARNPWYLSSDDYVGGRVMTGEELIGLPELRRTDFYRGLLEPRGLLHLLCGVVARQAGGVHCLAAYRAAGQPGFDTQERADLKLLLDHLALALEGRWRWQEADDLAQALLALAQHDTNPMLLVTAAAELVWCNGAAEMQLDRALGLRRDGARLVAAAATDRRLLAEVVARMAAAAPGQPPMVLSLASPGAAQPVVALLRALGPVYSRQAGARRGLALIALRGAQAGHDPASCVFAQRYELTAAQARVSALVFAGQPLTAIAGTLNVSENTVRSHLKQIFQKTDTHGQMELVHLHARICPSLP
ncbi:helix-turn-helix transcriptional regulator [Piscinibacter defluvii]|uniref:helix-turn-helix transcriptional regulator n=1 Tax=Piscinibacter defluvii TaxID=1796922 RepID=UPI000FDD3FAC|nr:helix-turn-helix transcriptional regulator [Piscinibacter defluvii]